MRPEFSNVIDVEVSTDPYPHLIIDDLFDEKTLGDIQAHWPESSRFVDEVLGVKFLALNRGHMSRLRQQDQEFWSDSMSDIHDRLIRSIFTRFRPALFERFPHLNVVETVQFRLMETDENYTGMDPHTHYSLTPTWLFTNLIYIDDDGRSSRGTTICWPNGDPVLAMAGYDLKISDGSDRVPKR